MSGICGILRFDGGPASTDRIAPMLEAMGALGETGLTWADEAKGIALGCRPLRITAEDRLHRPPVRSADGAVVLVADARLDNRDELLAALEIDLNDGAGRSDPELVLAAYLAWGEGGIQRLFGDFAFAVWDGRRRRLVLARDGIGPRLLYYHLTPNRLAFATVPAALLALDDVPATLNRHRVAESLVLIQDPVTTFYQGIDRLLPGHFMVAGPDGPKAPERFWSPEPTRRIVFGSDDEYVEGFLEVFDQTIRAHTRALGPIGIMLSGGLDSTSIAATAALQRRATGDQLFAFHAAPRESFRGAVRGGWVADESADVRAVVERHPNIELEIYRPSGQSLLAGLEQVFQHAGLPPRNPSAGDWFNALYGSARARGIGVMLAGHKGNATISYGGVRSLRDLWRAGEVRHVLHEVRAVAKATGQSSWSVLREQIVLPLAPLAVAAWYQQRHSRGMAFWSASYSAINSEFARSTGVDQAARADGVSGLRAERAGEIEYRTLALTAAADAPDLDSAARTQYGIETRSPACARRVVEYCLAIPGSQYLRNGVNRWLIRRAMRDRLPTQVVDRRTRGAQGADWAVSMTAMREEFRADLSNFEGSASARECLDLPRLRRLVDDWPATLGAEHEMSYHHLLLRGITMGRFILWFERTHG